MIVHLFTIDWRAGLLDSFHHERCDKAGARLWQVMSGMEWGPSIYDTWTDTTFLYLDTCF